jgi:serine/threonine-protein kinase HipA
MAYIPVTGVRISAFGDEVGAIALDPGTGFYAVEFRKQWLSRGINLSPLQLSLNNPGPYIFVNLPKDTFYGLPAFIADMLPDAFGNALVKAELVKRGLTEASITPLDRLAYQSGRGMGALEFKPDRGPKSKIATAINLAELVSAARAAVHDEAKTDRQAKTALTHLIQVGTSAGGARAKALIAWNPNTNEIRSGQLEADPGFEQWLIKFDGITDDLELGTATGYGRIEYAYYLMALDAGLEMTKCRLWEENDRAHFMTRRFDRSANQTKVHRQSLDAINRLNLGSAARHAMFRQMTFNVAAANCDDHTKNISFLMDQEGQWRLSPAYDITHAHNPKGEWTFQHQMSINGKFKAITTDDLLKVADRFAVPRAREVIAQVREATNKWLFHAASAGVPENLARVIAKDFPTF